MQDGNGVQRVYQMVSKEHYNKQHQGSFMNSSDMYKPLRYFGFFLVDISVAIIFCLYKYPGSPEEQVFLFPFAGTVSVLHMLIGIGVLTKNKKLFVFFKMYLKMLYIGFPIGTYIAKKRCRT